MQEFEYNTNEDIIYEVRGTDDPVDGDHVRFNNKDEAFDYASNYENATVWALIVEYNEFGDSCDLVDEYQISESATETPAEEVNPEEAEIDIEITPEDFKEVDVDTDVVIDVLLQDEKEAVDAYETAANVIKDEEAKEVFDHIKDEEAEHIDELQQLVDSGEADESESDPVDDEAADEVTEPEAEEEPAEDEAPLDESALNESSLVRAHANVSDTETLSWGWDKGGIYWVEMNEKYSADSPLAKTVFKRTYGTAAEAHTAFKRYVKKYNATITDEYELEEDMSDAELAEALFSAIKAKRESM